MKANELMVGDYVNYRGQIIKVTSLYDKGGSNEVGWSDKESVWVNGRCIEPIPLTPEILEKNGFNILRDAYGMSDPFWSYSNRSVLVDITIIRTNNVKVIDWFNVKISTRKDIKQISFCGVKYVHQLQHALRLCGIEKEIEL